MQYIVDILIFLWMVWLGYEGYKKGFARSFLEFAAFYIGIFAGLFFYGLPAGMLNRSLGLPPGISNLAGFTVVMLSIIFIFFVICGYFFDGLLKRTRGKVFSLSGSMLESIKGLTVAAIIISVLSYVPIDQSLKKVVEESPAGRVLALSVQNYSLKIEQVFGRPVEESMFFGTIYRARNDRPLRPGRPPERYLARDRESENIMLLLLNRLRREYGLSELQQDDGLANAALNHSYDMFKNDYFGHSSPTEGGLGNRLDESKIPYNYAGENLALAPNVEMAYYGLVESKGHRRNMLNPGFSRAGIGVVDGGPFQKMFTQNFAD